MSVRVLERGNNYDRMLQQLKARSKLAFLGVPDWFGDSLIDRGSAFDARWC